MDCIFSESKNGSMLKIANFRTYFQPISTNPIRVMFYQLYLFTDFVSCNTFRFDTTMIEKKRRKNQKSKIKNRKSKKKSKNPAHLETENIFS